jgi:lambda family phage portal protein
VTLLDRAIGVLSPRWELRRMGYRRKIERYRRYEGAARGRRTKGWRAPATSAARETFSDLAKLRYRTRDLVRNNRWAGKAVRVITNRMVAAGITPQPPDHLEGAWKLWAGPSKQADVTGKSTFGGQQRLSARGMVESGEALALRVRAPRSADLVVPLQIQLLEADHLDSTKNDDTGDGGRTIQGIQFDARGKPTGYWLYPRHPGDFAASRLGASRLFPARDVIHLFRQDRIGQVRGVPWGASCMLQARDLDIYEDAELQRQRLAAALAGYIETTGDPETETTEKDSTGHLLEDIEGGTLSYLDEGEKITFNNPPQLEMYADYIRLNLMGVAAGFGTTYEALSGDYSKVNFSSGRMGWLEFASEVNEWQRLTMIPTFCQRIWEWFVEAAFLQGLTPETVEPVTWTVPRREMIDPVKEIKGLTLQIRAGLTSLSEALRGLGHDPKELLEELASDIKLLQSLNLKLDSDPTNPAAGGITVETAA